MFKNGIYKVNRECESKHAMCVIKAIIQVKKTCKTSTQLKIKFDLGFHP